MVAQEPDTKYGSSTFSKNLYFLKSQEQFCALYEFRIGLINGLMFDVSSNLIFDLINCTIKSILNGQIKYDLLHRWFENFQNLHFNNRVL
jgi:hypothetical protein